VFFRFNVSDYGKKANTFTGVQAIEPAGITVRDYSRLFDPNNNIVYVATNTGNNNNNCTAQTSPCKTLSGGYNKTAKYDSIIIVVGELSDGLNNNFSITFNNTDKPTVIKGLIGATYVFFFFFFFFFFFICFF
jgi:hypothetical protein